MTAAFPMTVPPTSASAPARFWMWLLGLSLLGYAVLGKGFAYLSVPPLYAAELLMCLGVLCVACEPGALLRAVVFHWSTLPLYLFMAWGAVRTLPYLSEYGIDALRDGVLWGYGLFAILVLAVASRGVQMLRPMVKAFRRFAWVYPYLTVVALLVQIAGIVLPTLPDTNVPVLSNKTGDIAVHLAGASALFLVGLLPARGILWFICVFASVLTCASGNRGAAVSYLAATAFVLLLSPRARSLAVRFLLLVTLLLGLTLFIDPDVRLHQDREISLRQLAINYASVVTSLSDNPGNTEGTKQWRLMWWGRIVDYTIFGEYFWNGKGFGINLTTADGFRSQSGLLRSPHSVHMTVLARGGVIGLVLWLLLQGVWLIQVLRRHFRAARARHFHWSAMFVALGGYWVAFIVNASFDVFLEGPMGGVWFWSLFGFGLAAVRVYDSWATRMICATEGQWSPVIA